MSDQLSPFQSLPALPAGAVVPAMVAACGEKAAWRYLEFFAANIHNPNTRAAYARAASSFFAWCDKLGLMLPGIMPVHIAAWVETLTRDGRSAPTVKQHLAAVRMLFDWLVVGQVVPHNPAAAVRGPKHSMATGKTHMPSREEAKALIAAIDTSSLIGLRDRALIGTLLYTFGRIGAVTTMRGGDYYHVGKRWWVRLHEKGGKEHTMPVHHTLEEWLDAYRIAAGIADDHKGFLFRAGDKRTGRLTEKPLAQADAWRMIQRRAIAAGVETRLGCHSWRARGITAYLENGGLLEHAQRMAAHSSARGSVRPRASGILPVMARGSIMGNGCTAGAHGMNCVCCGSAAVTERREATARGYRRFRCRDCG